MKSAVEQILSNSKSRALASALFILAISFVHLVFKPFQMAYYSTGDFIFVNAAYFIISTLIVFLFLGLFPVLYKTKYESIIAKRSGRLSLLALIIAAIGLGFFLFKISFGFYALSLERVATGITALLGLAVIPMLFLLIMDQLIVPVKRTNSTILIDPKIGEVQINDVFCIYSEKNYVVWVYEENGRLVRHKTRGTIKSVREQLKNKRKIVQSHRAYLVNQDKILTVEKNNNSHLITLVQCPDKIPLSRSFYSNFRRT
ncbi:MAG: DNA-binding protein [Bacteroidetes bacterium]|nr:MAG: DNA-binding protein [Bacteroidota bacterium]